MKSPLATLISAVSQYRRLALPLHLAAQLLVPRCEQEIDLSAFWGEWIRCRLQIPATSPTHSGRLWTT